MKIPVYGSINVMGEYYIHLTLMDSRTKQSKKYRFQVDSGSSTLVINGDEDEKQLLNNNNNNSSTKQPKFREAFHFDESSALHCNQDKTDNGKKNTLPPCKLCYANTNQTNWCGFLLRYGDGSDDYSLSASGVVARIPTRITDVSSTFQMETINIILREGGNWPTKVDGILGLGFDKLNCNPTCFKPSWMSLFQNPSALKLCLGDKDGFLKTMTEEEEKNSKKSTTARFVECEIPPQYRNSYYTIPFTGVGLMTSENKVLVFSRPNDFAIVDSGTTLLLFPEAIWDEFTLQLGKHFPGIDMAIFQQEDLCLTEIPSGFPNLLLTLKQSGEGLIIPPSLYFIEYYDKQNEMNVYCLGVQKTIASKTIIGDSILRGFYTTLMPDRVVFEDKNDEECNHEKYKVGNFDGQKKWIMSRSDLKGKKIEIKPLSTRHGQNSAQPSFGLFDLCFYAAVFAFVYYYYIVLRRRRNGYRPIGIL